MQTCETTLASAYMLCYTVLSVCCMVATSDDKEKSKMEVSTD